MTLYEFSTLSEADQVEQVWNEGRFLLRRKLGRSFLILYAVDSFFVEIRYDRDQNRVTACRPFQSLTTLEPYLDTIQIGSIYSA